MSRPDDTFDDSWLSAYLDGELSELQRAEVERRLHEEGDWTARLEELQSVRDKFVALSVPAVSDDLADRIMRRIQAVSAAEDSPVSPFAASWRRRGTWIGASIAGIAVALALVWFRSPTDPEVVAMRQADSLPTPSPGPNTSPPAELNESGSASASRATERDRPFLGSMSEDAIPLAETRDDGGPTSPESRTYGDAGSPVDGDVLSPEPVAPLAQLETPPFEARPFETDRSMVPQSPLSQSPLSPSASRLSARPHRSRDSAEWRRLVQDEAPLSGPRVFRLEGPNWQMRVAPVVHSRPISAGATRGQDVRWIVELGDQAPSWAEFRAQLKDVPRPPPHPDADEDRVLCLEAAPDAVVQLLERIERISRRPDGVTDSLSAQEDTGRRQIWITAAPFVAGEAE